MGRYPKLFFDFKYKELNIVRVIFAIYISGFLFGTRNHIVDTINDGLFGYRYVPLPLNIYWTLLTILDPLAIILLLFSPFSGMALSVGIMASDIAVNVSVTLYDYFQRGVLTDGLLCLQITFGLFVFLIVPVVWKRLKTFRISSVRYSEKTD